MKTLFLITNLNKSFLNKVFELYHQEQDSVFVTDNKQIESYLKENFGIKCPTLKSSIKNSWAEKDRKFAELFMPGIFGDKTFDGTTLPYHKVLSMDRLSFYFDENIAKVNEQFSLIDFNKLIVPFDIYSPIVFDVVADFFGIKIAIQYEEPTNLEGYDCQILESLFNEIIKCHESENKSETDKIVELAQKVEQKKLLQIGEKTKVIGFVFSLPYEREIRNWLIKKVNELSNHDVRIFAFVNDTRAKQLMKQCIGFDNLLDNSYRVICDELWDFSKMTRELYGEILS